MGTSFRLALFALHFGFAPWWSTSAKLLYRALPSNSCKPAGARLDLKLDSSPFCFSCLVSLRYGCVSLFLLYAVRHLPAIIMHYELWIRQLQFTTKSSQFTTKMCTLTNLWYNRYNKRNAEINIQKNCAAKEWIHPSPWIYYKSRKSPSQPLRCGGFFVVYGLVMANVYKNSLHEKFFLALHTNYC